VSEVGLYKISGACYSDGTMPFVVKCCPVTKRWNGCCCSCDLRTVTLIVGWIFMARLPLLLVFSKNIRLSHRGAVISYFRRGFIQCFPTNCTVELSCCQKKPIPGLIKLSVLKLNCSKIPVYCLTALETFHGTLSRVVDLNRFVDCK